MTYPNATKSVYKRGADDGLWFGLYLAAIFLSFVFILKSSLSIILFWVLVIGVPFIIYRLIRRGYRADRCRSQFSALWLHGICIFFFGSLLMALVAYIYLRLINPSFMYEFVDFCIAVYEQVGSEAGDRMADLLKLMQQRNQLPSAIDVAVQLMWFNVFTGSILSMLLSFIVRITTHNKEPQPPVSNV